MIRLVAALATTALAVTGLVSPIAGAPQQQPVAPTLMLVDQTVTVAPDGDFTVLALALNAPDATEFAVDIYDRAPADEPIGPIPERDPEATFGPVAVAPTPDADEQAVGFTIELFRDGEPNPDPQWGHEIDEPGVYPVRVRLRDEEGRTVAVLMTAVLRLPDPNEQEPPSVAALLVDVDRPPPDDPAERRTRGTVDSSLLDALPTVLAALDERPGLPATFSATPDTVARMADDDEAATVLGALRTTLVGPTRTVLDASYVDLDVANLVASGLAAELEAQRDAGTRTITGLLEAPPKRTWRLRDRVDGASLAALAALGVQAVVLPDDAVEGTAATVEPASIAHPGGAMLATTPPPSLTVGSAAPEDPILDAHRLLARLAAKPGARTPIAIDPIDADPETLRVLFDALWLGSPLFSAATLGELLDVVERPPAQLAPPVTRNLGAYPDALDDARSALASYASMVPGQADLVAPLEERLLVSAARDLTAEQATSDARSVTFALAEPFGAITTPVRDTVTLGARDASFPLIVGSSLDYPVQVVIELRSSDRVEFPQTRIEATLEPGRQEIDIDVRTRATGDTPVLISVRTPDDGVLLAESRYTIRSTAVSGVGVVLTLGAAAFLVIWWGRHWRRNRGTARHARRRRSRPREV